jgi:hypothetical protein
MFSRPQGNPMADCLNASSLPFSANYARICLWLRNTQTCSPNFKLLFGHDRAQIVLNSLRTDWWPWSLYLVRSGPVSLLNYSARHLRTHSLAVLGVLHPFDGAVRHASMKSIRRKTFLTLSSSPILRLVHQYNLIFHLLCPP